MIFLENNVMFNKKKITVFSKKYFFLPFFIPIPTSDQLPIKECRTYLVLTGISWDKNCVCIAAAEQRLEGWLSVPEKQNIKKYGWRRQYVVVSSRKILFYASDVDIQRAQPLLILDIE